MIIKVKTGRITLEKALPWVLLIAGIVGLIASLALSIDTINLAKNPNYVPSCNLNPIVSCGSVIKTHQANAFGFPNPFLGLAAFGGMASISLALLAGAKLKRWFWQLFNAGLLFAVGFVHWFIFQSIYRIGDLCPYCMVTWLITITSFLYVTLYNIEVGNIALRGRWLSVGRFLRRFHLEVLVTWLLIIIALILTHFWYYWKTL